MGKRTIMKITLGDKVKDTVTGFTGIAVARVNWLHGCDRIIIQPAGTDKDGKIFESQHFDEPQVIVLQPKKVKEGNHSTGGFKSDIIRQKTF
jgi:hypothetical protein